jgi:hypothetical protein
VRGAMAEEVWELIGPGPLKGGTMGTLTMIKYGIVGFILLAIAGTGGYYVWEYHHRGKVIEQQKIEIANLKVQNEVLAKKQATFDDFTTKKKPVIQRRVQNEKTQVDQTVQTVDDAGLRALYDHYKLLPDPKVRLAPDGPGSRLKFTPRGAAGAP